MDKLEIYKYLKEKNIKYEITNHKPANSMDEIEKENLENRNYQAKNLFLRDDRKRNYYLIVLKGNKNLNLKEFKNKYNTRTLSFASEKDLNNLLKLEKGSISPLGILNDKENIIKVYLDKEFKKDNKIGIHPNKNDATIWMKFEDLIKIIRENGNQVNVTNI